MKRIVSIVDQTSFGIDEGLIRNVAIALQVQESEIASFWRIPATLVVPGSDPRVKQTTPWEIRLMDESSAGLGVHMDEHGIPFAEITCTKDSDDWTITASHEFVEMSVDPYGRRMRPGADPQGSGYPVFFLVEPCDPPEAFFYDEALSNGASIKLSDYVYPWYYRPWGFAPFTKLETVTQPYGVAVGGYLSWWSTEDYRWHQVFVDENGKATYVRAQERSRLEGNLRDEKDKALAEGVHDISGH